MTQEDKELLFQDLSARLPYGVIISVTDFDNFHFDGILRVLGQNWCRLNILDPIKKAKVKRPQVPLNPIYIKPYLRPMSSMTEEEKNELFNLCTMGDSSVNTDWESFGVRIVDTHPRYADQYYTDYSVIDWLNKKMFDFRGLIPKGLAISTEEFNPYKD